MKLLNERYVGTGVSWNYVNTTRIISRYWHETIDAGLCVPFNPQSLLDVILTLSITVVSKPATCTLCSAREMLSPLTFTLLGMSLSTFFGAPQVFSDLASCRFYDAGLNGYATLPVSYAKSPIYDGVVLFYATLPGGTSQERQGGTLIHEAGHWLGLRHTFQGGCTGVGDGVDDTPPQAEAHFGCPIGADTCPGDSLADPIRESLSHRNIDIDRQLGLDFTTR